MVKSQIKPIQLRDSIQQKFFNKTDKQVNFHADFNVELPGDSSDRSCINVIMSHTHVFFILE